LLAAVLAADLGLAGEAAKHRGNNNIFRIIRSFYDLNVNVIHQ
jgi:hypothetical protein